MKPKDTLYGTRRWTIKASEIIYELDGTPWWPGKILDEQEHPGKILERTRRTEDSLHELLWYNDVNHDCIFKRGMQSSASSF